MCIYMQFLLIVYVECDGGIYIQLNDGKQQDQTFVDIEQQKQAQPFCIAAIVLLFHILDDTLRHTMTACLEKQANA